MTTIRKNLTFEAKLPDGRIETFIWGEYLDYREWLDLPVAATDEAEHVVWLQSNNMSRVSVHLSLATYQQAKRVTC